MEDFAWIVIELIFAIMSVAFAYLFMRAFLKDNRDINIIWKIIAIAFVLILRIYTSLFLNEYPLIVSGISIIFAFVIGIVCFRARVFEIGLSAFLSFLAAGSSELVAVFIVTHFHSIHFSYIMGNNIYHLQGRTLLYLIFLILTILVNRFRSASIDTITNKLTLAMCVLPTVSILVAQQFVMHIVTIADTPSISEVIPLLSIIVVNIFIFILIENIVKQNEKNKTLMFFKLQNTAQQQHVRQLLGTYEQVRQMAHDFKHQVGILNALSEEKQYDELSARLFELSSVSHKPLVINTDNIMLDAVLSSKKEEAEKQGIQFQLKLDIDPNLSYMSIELCVLLCNALDNALEACNRSLNLNKSIELELNATTSVFMFKIRNTLGEKPELQAGIFKTKKEDNLRHGVGMQSMKQACKNLGGNITYNHDNEHFRLWVNIPL